MSPPKPLSSTRRSRDGCWTCKKRRKKCDGVGRPCGNCQRLHIECETGTKLVWEDDDRRVGMKRRGPAPKGKRQVPATYTSKPRSTVAMETSPAVPGALNRRVSDWPYDLGEPEWRLLDHYIQRFSRTYPAFSAPDNPFLRILLPLATRNRVVLDSLLALSGVQLWENGSFQMERTMLHLRHRAIQGSLDLLANLPGADGPQTEGLWMPHGAQIHAFNNTSFIDNGIKMDNFVALLATCVLLLLYEKLSGGDQGTATPHLQFFAALFPTESLLSFTSLDLLHPSQQHSGGPSGQSRPWSEALRFLSNLFLYNDLVRSISNQLPTLSTFYLGNKKPATIGAASPRMGYYKAPELNASEIYPCSRRFSLPNIVARCSAGDLSVADEEIAAWDGSLDWFPSFALVQRTAPEETKRSGRFAIPTADPFFVLGPMWASLGSFMDLANYDDEKSISELYRVAATIYRRQCQLHQRQSASNIASWPSDEIPDLGMGNLPSWGVELLRYIPEGSPWESCVLWPIGIVAKELTVSDEREYISQRLRDLEQRFKIRLYCTVREQLEKNWRSQDQGCHLDDWVVSGVMCG